MLDTPMPVDTYYLMIGDADREKLYSFISNIGPNSISIMPYYHNSGTRFICYMHLTDEEAFLLKLSIKTILFFKSDSGLV